MPSHDHKGEALTRCNSLPTCESKVTRRNIPFVYRPDVSRYRPEVYKSEKSKILKKIHKVALGKLLT